MRSVSSDVAIQTLEHKSVVSDIANEVIVVKSSIKSVIAVTTKEKVFAISAQCSFAVKDE